MMRFFFPLFIVFLALPLAPAQAAKLDTQNYRRAFTELDSNRPERALVYAHGRDPVLNKVIRSAYMAQDENRASFDEMAAFVNENPDWPNVKSITAVAERKLPSDASAQKVITWFRAHPPISASAFNRYIEALAVTGQMQEIPSLVRARWLDGNFTKDELGGFRARYQRYLSDEADNARLDRLLWKNNSVDARHMYAFVDEGHKALADARLALANQNKSALLFLDNVPSHLQDDPGLLFEKLRWNVRNDKNDEALEILARAPDDLGNPEAWWQQRQIMMRRVMEERNFKLAYKLAASHGQTDNKTLTQGEFLAGWLALRFLNDPDRARQHFQILYDNSTTPITRARGSYWLGRAYEALNNKYEAEQAYQTAAALNVTYYGQLATTRLYAAPIIRALPEPSVPTQVRQAFFNRDIIRAVEKLDALGENERARIYFRAATEAAKLRSDFALLTELAYQIGRPDYAIEAAKAANQKNMLMAAGGYPVLDRSLPNSPEPAFTHALIRQESMFNPQALSPAGAHGLMQLMPHTAKDVAKKLGVRFRQANLTNIDYNLRLGTHFIKSQLNGFDGSYVLALAAYNAGPRRVREWVREIGDPRTGDVDPIDWVEQIPIYETRNYVQRIIESLQIYRARLNGGQAPLLILKDLKR